MRNILKKIKIKIWEIFLKNPKFECAKYFEKFKI